MRSALPLAGILFISILLVAPAFADVSKNIAVQGRLTNPAGSPLPGQHAVTFKIYNVETGGTALATIGPQNVNATNEGMFATMLNVSALDFSQDYWLEFTIGSETLSPRQRLTAAPYALGMPGIVNKNGNIGIGTTNPLYGKLQVSGLTALEKTGTGLQDVLVLANPSGGQRLAFGTLASYYSGLEAIGDQITGILTFSNRVSGVWTEIARIQGGNVGIGTTEPQAKLHVNGSIKGSSIQLGSSAGNIGENWWEFGKDDGVTGTAIDFHGGSGTGFTDYTARIYRLAGDNGDWELVNRGSGSLYLGTDNSHQLTIKTGGNVGIGVTNPSAKLEIASSTNAAFRVGVSNNAANTAAQIRGSLAVVADNDASETWNGAVAWNFYNDGTSPSWSGTGLKHYGTAFAGTAYGITAANQGTLVFQNVGAGVVASNSANIYISPASAVSTTFLTNGNVGIGTTTPAGKLDVSDSLYTGTGQLFIRNQDLLNDGGEIVLLPSGGSYTNNIYLDSYMDRFRIRNNAGELFTIKLTDGKVGIGTASPSQKLHVVGNVNITGRYYGEGAVPSGAVMFFELAACPPGWSELTSAQGRYIVGLPAGGTLGGTVGTALTNLENRPVGKHLHSHYDLIRTDHSSGGEWTLSGGQVYGYVDVYGNQDTDYAGGVDGTNAPYIGLLACKKT